MLQTGHREHKPGGKQLRYKKDPEQTFSRGVLDAPASVPVLLGTHM